MLASENRKSLLFGVPGIVLQIVGNIMMRTAEGPQPDEAQVGLGALLALAGTVLLIVGLAFYAKAKGRHPAWGLMGLLSIIGLIVLALLKDYSKPARR